MPLATNFKPVIRNGQDWTKPVMRKKNTMMPIRRPGKADMLGAPPMGPVQQGDRVGGRYDPNRGQRPAPTLPASRGGLTGPGNVKRKLPPGRLTRERIY